MEALNKLMKRILGKIKNSMKNTKLNVKYWKDIFTKPPINDIM